MSCKSHGQANGATMAEKIRYAVVGLGHIAQTAVLPAFQHARSNSKLTALVSGDPKKLTELGKRYGIDRCYSYADYVDCLESGEVDAVYICTPNTLHHYFAGLAAQRGIHVLCEKPMATDESTCLSMIQAAERNRVKLMVAYRLHFDAANLYAIDAAQSKQIGDLKIFHSVFTFQVRDHENIRLKRSMGGGPLFDIGIYCINAARYLFRDEPIEAIALSGSTQDIRFNEVDEVTSAVLRFPENRMASFTVSFGSAGSSSYELIGTTGSLRLEQAYGYSSSMTLQMHKSGKILKTRFNKRDQFAPELVYFSDCILKDREPEPSGWEGLADARVIAAIQKSAETGAAVKIDPIRRTLRPSMEQKISRPYLPRPHRPVRVVSPHG